MIFSIEAKGQCFESWQLIKKTYITVKAQREVVYGLLSRSAFFNSYGVRCGHHWPDVTAKHFERS